MKLLTNEIKQKLPKLYSQDNVEDPVCHIKFFCPWSSWTWYVLEGEEQEGEDYLFFGLVRALEIELGYFSLSELQSVKGPMGLSIERDLYYKPQKLSELNKG